MNFEGDKLTVVDCTHSHKRGCVLIRASALFWSNMVYHVLCSGIDILIFFRDTPVSKDYGYTLMGHSKREFLEIHIIKKKNSVCLAVNQTRKRESLRLTWHNWHNWASREQYKRLKKSHIIQHIKCVMEYTELHKIHVRMLRILHQFVQ